MGNIDPKSLGIPNINFSIDISDPERQKKYLKQRIARGFDDTETWGLNVVIVDFVLPRLRLYKELASPKIEWCGFDNDEEEALGMEGVVDKMIFAFETIKRDDDGECVSSEDWDKVQEGLRLFAEYFTKLWW